MCAVLLVYVADNSERFYGAKKIRATSAPVVQNVFRSANGISFLATTYMGNVNLVSLAESIVRTAQRKNDEIFDGSRLRFTTRLCITKGWSLVVFSRTRVTSQYSLRATG